MTPRKTNADMSARQLRLDQLRRQQSRRSRRRTMTWVGAVVAILVIVGGGASWAVLANRPAQVSLGAVKTYPVSRPGHVTTTVRYPQTPPVGGDHDPTWLNCGIYTAPVRNENAVHDLEHGAVWITYQPSLPATQVKALRELVGGQTYLTLSPYPGLPAPVVASAWGVQLRLPNATDKRLKAFVTKYKQGPQTPEPGAPCTGGTGSPAS